jgi:hypothetical protein
MTNPVIHVIAIIAAIIIPGGMLVYLAWRVRNKCRALKAANKAKRKKDPIDEIREAFQKMYPVESLRTRGRRRRLSAYKTRPQKKPPE